MPKPVNLTCPSFLRGAFFVYSLVHLEDIFFNIEYLDYIDVDYKIFIIVKNKE